MRSQCSVKTVYVASETPRTTSRTMIGQFLDTAASINYSGDVAKAINFIGRRPGYGSSAPVTVALLQRRILCSVFLGYARARANTLLTSPLTPAPATGKLRKSCRCSRPCCSFLSVGDRMLMPRRKQDLSLPPYIDCCTRDLQWRDFCASC